MEEADAHECLSALLDAMHEGSLGSMKDKPPPQELADTFVHRIFGGLTKNEVRCQAAWSNNPWSCLSNCIQHVSHSSLLCGIASHNCKNLHNLFQ